MKRVVVDRYGGPEVLRVAEEDDPRPEVVEVRVRVLAAGVSFTDAQLRAGTYIPGEPKQPFTPGYEAVYLRKWWRARRDSNPQPFDP